MTAIYRLSIRSLGFTGLSRVLELDGQDTLGELQGLLATEFRLDSDHLWAFWLGGEWFERELEYRGEPFGGGMAHSARIHGLGLQPGDVLAHVHDFGEERRHVIVVLAVTPREPGIAYPRVVERLGEAPPYYPGEDGEEVEELAASASDDPSPGLVERVNAAMEAFFDQEHQPLSASALRSSAEVAREVLEACPTHARLAALDQRHSRSVGGWLEGVARILALRGEADQAVAIATRLAAWRSAPDRLLVLAGELVDADHSEYPGALAAFRGLLAAVDRAPEWRYGRADLHWARLEVASGHPAGAETRLRAMLARRHLSNDLRITVVKTLADLLGRRGARDDAEQLRTQVPELERRRAEALGGTVRNEGAQVGRNDPCTCGSGKKFKKCCGA